ncbi:MAG: serine hydrolase [Pseudomonadales bacterium]|jgi:CubicO group peptidase (beta-lactamase class C family)|nr:serine hydrolase [Pseudomonadales bacterium]
MATRPPFPRQPEDLAWPVDHWPTAALPEDLDRSRFAAAIEALTRLGPDDGDLHALLVVHRGRLVLEHYGPGIDATSTLQSWSMAKSMLQASIGFLVAEGRIDPDAPAPVPEWSSPGDARTAISWRQLLAMRSGLEFREDYVDAGVSDVIEMLWQRGRNDVAAFAAGKPLLHAPGTTFNYASGTTNILARALGTLVGGGEAGMRAFLQERLFGPLGMDSATPKFDPAGTWKASSFCFCTARDFARFGLLYLRGGVWNGQPLLPEAWIDEARTPTHETEGECYGSHWWIEAEDPRHFYASGYEGQRILLAPEKDLLAIRLGQSPNARVPELLQPLHALVRAFPDL